MDFTVQKAVELGVASITPLLTERSVVRLDGVRLEKRLRHWRGVLIAACAQSGRRQLPSLFPPQPLPRWIATEPRGGLLLDHRFDRLLTDIPPPSESISLLIGPEGGLTDRERDMAHQAGLTGVRLGPRILRTETAPLASIAAIQALWGDYRTQAPSGTQGDVCTSPASRELRS